MSPSARGIVLLYLSANAWWDLRRRKERGLSVNVESLNRHISEVVVKLQEDVGLKAGGQIDSAERSLTGMVASLFIVASVRTKPATR
jgi:hypothetical protein